MLCALHKMRGMTNNKESNTNVRIQLEEKNGLLRRKLAAMRVMLCRFRQTRRHQKRRFQTARTFLMTNILSKEVQVRRGSRYPRPTSQWWTPSAYRPHQQMCFDCQADLYGLQQLFFCRTWMEILFRRTFSIFLHTGLQPDSISRDLWFAMIHMTPLATHMDTADPHAQALTKMSGRS